MRRLHFSLRRAPVLVAIPLSVLAIASCGGDDNESSSTSASTAATTPTTSETTTTETFDQRVERGQADHAALSADASAIKSTRRSSSAGRKGHDRHEEPVGAPAQRGDLG